MQPRKVIKGIVPYSPGRLEPGAIKLASNENPLGPSPLALKAIAEAARGVNLYPDGASAALKAAIAAKRAGGALGPSSVVTGNGSDEILQLIAWAFIEPGLNAIGSACTFSEYAFAVNVAGGEMRQAPLREGRFDLAAIAALADANTRVAYLCNPNNPTGTYFTVAELDAFLDAVGDDVVVVLDEAYREYVDADDYPDSDALVRSRRNVIALATFSKIYGLAGLRVGYGIAHEGLASWVEKAREPFNVNLLAQAAALAALGDESFVAESRRLNKEGLEFIAAGLDRLGLRHYPSQSNFVCFDTGRDCMAMFEEIMRRGVTVRPLKGFGLPTWLRVSTGLPEQNTTFLDALEASLKAVPAVG
jgi:histidinol-phosphate aminotransferase